MEQKQEQKVKRTYQTYLSKEEVQEIVNNPHYRPMVEALRKSGWPDEAIAEKIYES